MSVAALTSLVLFSFAMSITPGPNNLLLTTSGLAYGFRRTLPAMAGTLVGITLLFLVSGAGVGALVLGDPRSQIALRMLGALYLVYLASRLWRSAELRRPRPAHRCGSGMWPDSSSSIPRPG